MNATAGAGPSEVVLFSEDFSSLPIRVIAGDYSPAGEYHVPAAPAESGRWREVVIGLGFGRLSLGNWQVVQENDGSRALEQICRIERPESPPPMLAAGDPAWEETTVRALLWPLTVLGRRALLFRFRHPRRYYAAIFEDGTLKVARHENAVEQVLGQVPCALAPEGYTEVAVINRGERIEVRVEGRETLICRDDSPGAFRQGAFALSATHLTRFKDLRVTTPAEVAERLNRETETGRRTLARLRAAHPRPRIWRRIPTPRFGTDRNLRAGDLDGDGRPELVIARRTDRLGGDNHSSITSLAAYDLDGRLLWTLNDPGLNPRPTTCDLPFQVHDWDGDGKAEVVFCRDWELFICEGATGRILRRMRLPRHPAGDGLRVHRIFGDSLYFCDLTGSGRPECLILKDRYRNLWAYDRNLELLWQFTGQPGHFIHSRDVDGDGKEEVIAGCHLLDHNGACRWTKELTDHSDNAAFVDLHESAGGAGPVSTRVVLAASDAGFYILGLDGRTLVQYPIGHAQSLYIGRLAPETDGLRIVCNTFWGAAGIVAVFDETGGLRRDFQPMPYACLLQPVNWVPRSAASEPSDLLLLSTHPRDGGLMDGHGRRVVEFLDDGHPWLCCDARDLDGDGLDEVLCWDETAVWIYKADTAGREPANYPRRNPWWNDSNYRAQLSLPAE